MIANETNYPPTFKLGGCKHLWESSLTVFVSTLCQRQHTSILTAAIDLPVSIVILVFIIY